MRLQNVWSGRPNYYDRNAKTVVIGDFEPLSGGDTFTSTVYTVPANRLAFVTWFSLMAYRDSTLFTIAGNTFVNAHYVPAGGSDFSFAAVVFNGTQVGDRIEQSGATQFVARPGDQLYCDGNNNDSGGLVNTLAQILVVEYDE